MTWENLIIPNELYSQGIAHHEIIYIPKDNFKLTNII
jgi:hypothetical protein